MNRTVSYYLVAVFCVFIGSQITEGFLLLPYWKSLSANDFYIYYDKLGPTINKFYGILTVLAALIPIALTIFCFVKKREGLYYSMASTFFTLLFVSLFFFYFKYANQLFFDGGLDSIQLKNELNSWGNWHWLRVVFQIISLFFLILSLNKIAKS